jgi:hypothetical protein
LDTEIGNVDLLRRIFVIVHSAAGISFLGIIILATKGAVRHTGDLLEREMFQKAEKNLPLSVSTASPISSQSIDSYPNLFRDFMASISELPRCSAAFPLTERKPIKGSARIRCRHNPACIIGYFRMKREITLRVPRRRFCDAEVPGTVL